MAQGWCGAVCTSPSFACERNFPQTLWVHLGTRKKSDTLAGIFRDAFSGAIPFPTFHTSSVIIAMLRPHYQRDQPAVNGG